MKNKKMYAILAMLLSSCSLTPNSSSSNLTSNSLKESSSVNYVSFVESSSNVESSSILEVSSSTIELSSEVSSSSVNSSEEISSSDVNSSSSIENSSSEEVSSSIMDSSSEEISSSSTIEIKYTLRGKIVDTNNNGVSGILVKLLLNNEELTSTTTDANGAFTFTSLNEGIYRLSFIVNDSTYEIQGTHGEFSLSGEEEEFTYPTIIIKKNNIQWGELS